MENTLISMMMTSVSIIPLFCLYHRGSQYFRLEYRSSYLPECHKMSLIYTHTNTQTHTPCLCCVR